MPETFQYAIQEGLAACGEVTGPVLVGLSGGPDSMALVHGLRSLACERRDLSLHVVHVDHQLRAESADEAEQVRNWCEALDVDCRVVVITPARAANGTGVEEAARNARYQAFREHAITLGCRFVALAHHADDNVETILHHILRGTGIAGLRGIPRTRQLGEGVRVIRPLLSVTRGQILEFVSQLGIDCLEDSSNRDTTRKSQLRFRQRRLPPR